MKTNEELRVMVAEELGWEKLYKGPEDNRMVTPDGSYSSVESVPNYPLSLDACYQMEETIKVDPFLWQKFVDFLNEELSLDDAIHALPRQRCIAFLKTKGKL